MKTLAKCLRRCLLDRVTTEYFALDGWSLERHIGIIKASRRCGVSPDVGWTDLSFVRVEASDEVE